MFNICIFMCALFGFIVTETTRKIYYLKRSVYIFSVLFHAMNFFSL